MSLAEVTFIKPLKVRRYGLCGCVAACYIKSMVVCVLFAVQSETEPGLSFTRLLCKVPDYTKHIVYVSI